jgi:hypothetical protein
LVEPAAWAPPRAARSREIDAELEPAMRVRRQ